MSSLNILVIPAWFNHKNKAEGVFIHQFCETLQSAGHQVSLLYVQLFSLRNIRDYFKPVIFSFPYNYNIITVKQIVVPFAFSNHKFALFKKMLGNNVMRAVKKINPQIIHVQSLCNNLTPIVVKTISQRLNLPYVITEHYSSFKEAGNIIFQPYSTMDEARLLAQNAKVRLGVSRYACRKFEEFFNCSYDPFPNFINPLFISEPFVPPANGLPFRFVIIAALERHKGHSSLLRAFRNAFPGNAQVQLHIIGTGSEEKSLIDMVKQLDLEEQVVFHGALQQADCLKVIDTSHVVISASKYETFGLTLVEGMLRGRPVLSTKSGGPQELITDKSGLLCEVEDEKHMTVQLQKIHETYFSYNFLSIREDAISKFSPEILINNLEHIYNKVLSPTAI